MTKSRARFRWGIERRLQFIEFRLFWDGHFNRADLVKYFGISIAQASADVRRYQELARRNLRYDRKAKTYVATDEFSPVLLQPSARQYVTELRSVADGVLPPEATWFSWVPSLYVVPLIQRRLDADTLREILVAIRTSAAVHIHYQSFSRPNPTWRWIAPHALGFDGFRWHVRAWCPERKAFRDFVLARILRIRDKQPTSINPDDDVEWRREITMRLGPHPRMNEAVRRAIELDYGMVHGVVEIRTRACFSFYLERMLGLDLDPDQFGPERQQVVLLNRTEVEAARR